MVSIPVEVEWGFTKVEIKRRPPWQRDPWDKGMEAERKTLCMREHLGLNRDEDTHGEVGGRYSWRG